jgi:hypothetical protein
MKTVVAVAVAVAVAARATLPVGATREVGTATPTTGTRSTRSNLPRALEFGNG